MLETIMRQAGYHRSQGDIGLFIGPRGSLVGIWVDDLIGIGPDFIFMEDAFTKARVSLEKRSRPSKALK